MANVKFKNIAKKYPDGTVAVNGVNLDIANGEFVVLVGPSGCGKSTTLRMLAGLEEITDGEIMIGDRVVNNVPPKDRNIAMVFQNYALYPNMTVARNMAFGLKLRGASRAEIDKRIRWAADILGLEKLLDRKPRALSGGQRQRVAVGRAIVRQPEAFLFDEPLSNLDAKLRVQTRAELKQLHQRLKTTTIYVTHDQEEAMTLGDRVVVMLDGQVQQCDTPMAVYRSPANRFVAGFLGTPSMSFLNGCLKRTDGLQFHAKHIDMKLTDAQAVACEKHVGREIVMGIRPEAIDMAKHSETHDNSIHVRVDVVEPLGSLMDVYLRTLADDPMVARIPASDAFKTGDQCSARIDATQCHFFEPGKCGINVTRDAITALERIVGCQANGSEPSRAGTNCWL